MTTVAATLKSVVGTLLDVGIGAEEKEFSLDIIDIDMKLKIFFIKQVFYIFILYIAPAYLSMYSHP